MDKRLLNYPLSSLVIWLFHIEKFLSVKRKSPGQQVSHVNVSKRENVASSYPSVHLILFVIATVIKSSYWFEEARWTGVEM